MLMPSTSRSTLSRFMSTPVRSMSTTRTSLSEKTRELGGVAEGRQNAREAAMQVARKDIASYVFGVESETSRVRNQLHSVYMKESSLWLRDGQPMVCVLASINHVELQSAMSQ